LLKRNATRRLAQIDRQIAAIDAALKARLRGEPELVERFEIFVSIPGIGALTAITMLIEMPELGQLDNRQVASLAGLAPIVRDSGQHRGKRRIHGGRAILRQALYMPGLVAARYNTDMKAKYQALVAACKPAKVAITAVMRKLVILANELLRANRPWTQEMA
jgi:transposase